MELNKNSKKADAMANLYRSAYYLAKGDEKLGLDFLKKAQNVLGIEIAKINDSPPRLLLAEKVLDQYCQLKNLI